MRSIICAVPLMAFLASPAIAEVQLPKEVTDGMYVTLAEVRANSESTFRAFAGAGHGSISRNEFVSVRLPAGIMPSQPDRALLGRLFKRLDANSDGTLTLAEWRQRIQRDLQFADQNRDGRITLKELANARENMSIGDALGMVF